MVTIQRQTGAGQGGAHENRPKGKRTPAVLGALAIILAAGIFILSRPGSEAAPESAAPALQSPAAPATPEMRATPEPSPFAITEDWFDDALFVGDSLTGPLYNYTLVNGGLGDAVIVYANGYACRLSGRSDQLLAYRGRGMSVEDLAAEVDAGKLFILLAMNDIGAPIDELRESWEALLARVNEKCPGIDIYIQSGTPIYDETAYFTNDNMREYNDMLKTLCSDLGCTYVDIAEGLADETGRLKQEYHLDFVHFDEQGCAIWVENLYDTSRYTPSPTA